MYLKSIEIHGFKSFANKIVLGFKPGITGIVGPNGSGKSNVADAVRWVLGEQRIKQLRGASMQDVIFAGTESRKPLGYAYVAITMDNSDHSLAIDFEEVTIARRLYRSGESEYLINGTPCRLKDVNELFYDTGVGKEGYSIIGQGQIELILSGKPEERRELFDEAAGIVKYKRRKNNAVKKLEDEKTNKVRVRDILTELERQVGPLEKQAEKAREFLNKREELKNIDVNVFLLENEKQTEELSGFSEKLETAKKSLEETKTRFDSIKGEYESAESQIEKLEELINEKRQELSSVGDTRSKLEGEVIRLKEQILSASDNGEHFEKRRKALQTQIAEKDKELKEVLKNKKEFDDQLKELNDKKSEALNRLNELRNKTEELNEKIENGKSAIIKALNDRAGIKSRLSGFETRLEQVNIRKAELNSRLLRAKSDEAKHDEEINALKKEFDKINGEIEDLNNEESTLEEKNHEITDELALKDQEFRDLQVTYHQKKSKLEAVNNFNERYEGYGHSVQRVMEHMEDNKGIIGVVADIIKVEKKYEIAIETALGGNIQNIVTKDEDTAKEMIEFLKKNRFGRATFLPLTSIKDPQEFKTPEVLDEKGVIGLACDVVKTKKEYRDVALSMLGRIVVVDNVDNAVKIARKYRYGIRMVTIEGELLVPGGAISGGAFKNKSNLLSRAREIDELSKEVKECLEKTDKVLNEIEKIKEKRNKIRRDIEEVKGRIQEKFIEQNTARLNVMQAEEKKSETGKGYEELKEEQEEIAKTLLSIEEEKKDADRELADSEALQKETEKNIEIWQKEMDELLSKEGGLEGGSNEIELSIGKINERITFEQMNLDRIEGEKESIKRDLDEVIYNKEKAQSDITEKKERIEELEKTIRASHDAQSENEGILKESVEKKEELSKKVKEVIGEREKLSGEMNSLDKEVFRLNAQKERIEENLEGRINYMWTEYEITLSDAKSLRDESLSDLTVMKRDAAALKDSIKRLGDVNVNAIEEYREVSERYQTMNEQYTDLEKAEAELNGIIEELDVLMRKQFEEKFAEIRVEFDKVFKELFGGGKGTLELTEDEDILEAGIRINAQPPGKKLQNMMQLSGGEKSLTAIALLFAIQNLKPSPFCLLDEIEAALDESNVGRFAGYLHKLTKHTQFIVITHRRGTMGKADRLYGITMQEKGVSTLVSVDLIDKELDE